MRADDRPVPTIGGDRPDVEPWPAALHIGVERQPVPVHTYDDYTAHYHDAGIVYDDTTAWPYDRLDVFCQFHGLEIATGSPDDEGIFDASRIEMTLDNRDGTLSQYDSTGRLVDWIPGAALDVWADVDGEPWWLFGGKVTAWRELGDGTIEVEAFDAFVTLNQEVDEWSPGVHNQTPRGRLTSICTRHNFGGATRFDVGDVTLLAFDTEATPLEEMQGVALSDGGILVCDADGTPVYRDRRWLVGRPDQTTIPVFSDNYCAAPIHVWDAEITTDDDTMVNTVTLTNLTDITVTAIDIDSVNLYGPKALPFKRTNEQWVNVTDGNDLADWLLARRGGHYLRIQSFELHLADPGQDLWRTAIDLRLGDTITWIHEQPTTTGQDLVIIDLAVQQITHDITPESWVTTIATTRAIGSRPIIRYDQTALVYDDDDPAAVYAV